MKNLILLVLSIAMLSQFVKAQSFDIELQNANINCIQSSSRGWEILSGSGTVFANGIFSDTFRYDTTCYSGTPVSVRYNIPGCNPIIFTVDALTGVPATPSCNCPNPPPTIRQFSAIRMSPRGNCTYTIRLQY
ncbi:hypothetical protein LBMAG26_08570 [Bacteroidota bacterium]|nr:hypothetical protein LBMAG26_08570 [Bacteroidota bacterium]